MKYVFQILKRIDSTGFVKYAFSPAIFFGLPLCLSIISVAFQVELTKDALPILISVFSIISALLFGAMFSIFSVVSSIDRSRLQREFRNMAPFKRKMRELNRAVVYLVALSAITVCITLVFYVIDLSEIMEGAILFFLTTHFFCIFFPLLIKIYYILELGYRKV